MELPEETQQQSSAAANQTTFIKSADRPHYWTVVLSSLAITMALLSSAIAIYSAHIARLQYQLALEVTEENRQAAQKQAENIERSRKAAEDSALAAQALANANIRGVEIASKQATEIERARKAAEGSASAAQALAAANNKGIDIAARQANEIERARKAAEDSAAYAKNLADINARNARAAERPWVAITRVDMALRPQGTITVHVTNTGKTPALDTEAEIKYYFASDRLTAAKSLPTGGERNAWGSRFSTFPGTPAKVTARLTELQQSQIDSVLKMKVFLYIYGRVEYKDSENLSHETLYCYLFEPANNSLASCGFGNVAN